MEDRNVRRKKYDRAFKLEAIRTVKEARRQVTDVARALDINANLIHRWRQRLERDGAEAFPGKCFLKSAEEELRRLRRENADLEEERDILKRQ